MARPALDLACRLTRRFVDDDREAYLTRDEVNQNRAVYLEPVLPRVFWYTGACIAAALLFYWIASASGFPDIVASAVFLLVVFSPGTTALTLSAYARLLSMSSADRVYQIALVPERAPTRRLTTLGVGIALAAAVVIAGGTAR